MERIYFLSPNMAVTNAIVDELQIKSIIKDNIKVIGQDNFAIEKNHLPHAKLTDKTDVLAALVRGGLLGAATGLIAGITIKSMNISNIDIGLLGVLVITVVGAAVGAWASSMIGVSVIHQDIEKYEEAIHRGQYLIVIDLPKEDINFISTVIKKHHPQVMIDNYYL